MRRWRNLPFRRGRFQEVPPRVVLTPHPPAPQPLSHDAPRFLPLPRRGRIAQPVPVTVTVTVQPVTPQIIASRRRSLLALRRGRFSPPPAAVQVRVSVQLGHDPARLPFTRRGRFLAQPVTVTVATAPATVPAPISHDAPRFIPWLRRGRYQPTPVAVTVIVTPHPIVARIPRAQRAASFRAARGRFFLKRLIGQAPFTHPPLCIGGTIAETNINGTAQVSAFNGTGVTLQYNGAAALLVYNGTGLVVDPHRNGTAVTFTYNGTMTELVINGTETAWCMIAVALTLGEFDDTSVNLAFTTTGGGALDITGATIDVYLKTAAGILDTDASTKHYSSGGGSPAITITNAPGGLATCQIPAADIISAGFTFWKASVTISSKRNTAMYGTVTITLL